MKYTALALIAGTMGAATGALSVSHPDLFQPYLGSLNPLLAVLLATALGWFALRYLQSRGWFESFVPEQSRTGVPLAAVGATAFALVTVGVDLWKPFPPNLNVPSPQAWLFYPTIAYLVEMVFHAVPLALLLGVGSLLKEGEATTLLWPCILITALLEPSLQLGLGFSVLVGIHVFAFNLFQLWLFRRYDFVSMLSARLAYYLEWHIVWGHLRLRLLF
jgi:hypothetical protein